MEESSSSEEGRRDASVYRSETARFRLTRGDRIRLSSDFRKIMKEGARYRTPHFRIRMLKNLLGRTRLGIAVGKKVGTACTRNRVKRRLREYFRLNREKMPPDTDMVFIAIEGANTLDAHGLATELDRFFAKEFRPLADMRSP